MIVLWFLAGSAVEVLSMLTRWWSAARMRSQNPKRAVTLVIVGFLFRLGCTALVFGLALFHDATYGLAAFLGHWLFRWITIWWMSHHMTEKAKSPSPNVGSEQ